MAVAFLISCAALFLEHQNLVVLEVFQDLALHRGAFYYRCTYFDLTVVVCEQDFVETYGRIFFALKTVNIKFPTFFSFKLLTCNLYYNVHLFDGYVFEHNSECKYTHIYFISNIPREFFSARSALAWFWAGSPRTVPHDAVPSLQQRAPAHAGRGFMNRILIVSDDIFLRDMVRLSLIDMHTEVRCAADADEMEGLCRRVLFDLVIVLHVAPFLCGRDVVRGVRPAGLRRPLFYVVSWLQSEQAVLSLLECGVDQYMAFPLSLQRLRGKVSNDLNRLL